MEWITLVYLLSGVAFIFGLKRLSSPRTARSGNAIASLGMLVAIAATLLNQQIVEFWQIGVGVLVGGGLGAFFARTVQMTSMPQLVAVLNGFGGGASQLVAAAEFLRLTHRGDEIDLMTGSSIMLASIIGAVTLSGSFIAYAKLQGLKFIADRAVVFPGRHLVSGLLLLGTLGLGAMLVNDPSLGSLFLVMHVVAMLLGVLLVIAIGGADMPVVVALLNSYSGLAGAMAGFIIDNNALIITGALVGASGLILTKIMCKAMNRSIGNVIFGGFGAEGGGGGGGGPEGTIREVDAEGGAMLMAYANQVVIVPGYGLAVAQAQHVVRELADLLEKRGVEVKYAIHPVAGRMPGHMNVLLAEANVPYEKLWEMERINSEFDRTDVALVIGANDVVNPAARHDTSSPIYGMPILDVDNAANIVVMKRSMNPGFAGIQNELFFHEKTRMLFGDAKARLNDLVEELKQIE
ncbi:MAG: NAD(P)(+) transhydrogenase (Re/Si-specific) subunit beta [Planctomycetota bacterium JB042]